MWVTKLTPLSFLKKIIQFLKEKKFLIFNIYCVPDRYRYFAYKISRKPHNKAELGKQIQSLKAPKFQSRLKLKGVSVSQSVRRTTK